MISNGQKAAQLAVEHVERIEAELESNRTAMTDLVAENSELKGRLAEQAEALLRAEQRAQNWAVKAGRIAQSLADAATVIVDGSTIAREVLGGE